MQGRRAAADAACLAARVAATIGVEKLTLEPHREKYPLPCTWRDAARIDDGRRRHWNSCRDRGTDLPELPAAHPALGCDHFTVAPGFRAREARASVRRVCHRYSECSEQPRNG